MAEATIMPSPAIKLRILGKVTPFRVSDLLMRQSDLPLGGKGLIALLVPAGEPGWVSLDGHF